MKSRPGKILLRILRTYLILLVALYFVQRWLIYHPVRASESEMVADATAADLVPWKDASGTIIGWHGATHAAKPANRLIVFHGNAGNALYRELYVSGFGSLQSGELWEVYLFEYPGYGARPGKPSREVFDAAARDAVRQLLAEDDRPLYVLGESIGGGVACDVAASEPERVRGVVLMTPFARLAEVAQAKVPFLPGSLLLRDRWDNIAALQRTRAPVAVFLAGCDEVVGCEQGEKLFASLGDRPSRRWFFPEAQHNTINFSVTERWWGELSEFLLGNTR